MFELLQDLLAPNLGQVFLLLEVVDLQQQLLVLLINRGLLMLQLLKLLLHL